MVEFIRNLIKWIRSLLGEESPVEPPVPDPAPTPPDPFPPEPTPGPPVITQEYLCGLGDPENILYRDDRDQIIDRMIKYGGNALYYHVSCAHGGDTPSGNPFKNGDPNQGLDSGIAARLKGMVDKMDAANIWSYLFLYDDSSQPFGNYDTVTASEDQYIRQLVTLVGHARHLIWSIGEEYSEAINRARASDIARRIHEYDLGRHKIAIHQHSGISFDFGDDPYIKEFCVQLNEVDRHALHGAMVRAKAEAHGRYSITLGESTEPGILWYGVGGTMLRKNWACAMAGANVLIYGVYAEGHEMENLDFTYLKAQHTFINSIPDYWQMENMDSLKTGATEYVMKNPLQDSWLLWTSLTGPLGVNYPLQGEFTLSWLDCRNGAGINETKTFNGVVTFNRPSGISPDCAVYLRK